IPLHLMRVDLADGTQSLPLPPSDQVSVSHVADKARKRSAVTTATRTPEPPKAHIPEVPAEVRAALEAEVGNAPRSLLYDTALTEEEKRRIDESVAKFNQRPENHHRQMDFSSLEQHVRQSGKFLVTFSGFSNSLYHDREHVEQMLARVVAGLDPDKDMLLS